MINKLIFCLLFFPSIIFSQITVEKDYYKSWSVFLGSFSEILNNVTNSQTLAQFLFNSFSELNISVYTIPILKSDMNNIGLGIDVGGGRRVIYNNNIDLNYTVIDKFLIGIRPEFSGSYSGAKVGVKGQLAFWVTNVRQVGTNDIDRLEPIDKKIKEYRERHNKEKGVNYTPEQIKVDSDTYSNFLPADKKKVQRMATFGRIWNPITSAFRLPLTPNAAERLGNNEMLGYTILGGIELHAGFGVSLDPAGLLLRTGVDASVYFKGSYEIVVLREEPQKAGDNFVRVRIGKSKGVGYTFGVGSEESDSIKDITQGHRGPVEGNFIISTAMGLVSIRPFRVEWDQNFFWIFNQVYRFDLNNLNARAAYQGAVLGNFKLANIMALDDKGNIRENGPVTRILTVNEKRNTKTHRASIDLFLFKLKSEGVIRKSDKIIVDEKGEERTLFELETINSRNVSILFAFIENRSHKFLFTTDIGDFNKTPKKAEAVTLMVEAQRKDTNTTRKEYKEYVDDLEGAINSPGLLPTPPLLRLKQRESKSIGGIDFYYKLKFNWPQIEKLINYPPEKMWDALIVAFNAQGLGWENISNRRKLIAKSVGIYAGTLPVTIVGSKFPPKDNIIIASIKYSYWLKLKDELKKGPKPITEALGKFFRSGDYGPEMVKLLRVVLVGEDVPYKIKIYNPLLGEVPFLEHDGIGLWRIDPVEESMNVSLNRYRENFEMVTVENVVAEFISNEYVRLSFNLDKVPHSVFFNLQKSNILIDSFNNISMGSMVLKNKNNMFKKGRNSIMVKLADHRNPLNNLFNQLDVKKNFFPNQYRINVAATLDGKRYGYSASDLFRLIYVEKPDALQKFISYTVEDFGLCMGRSALDLILFLEKRPYRVCPDSEPHNPDGTCVNGMYPYEHFKNRSNEENLAKRDAWILKTCPKEGTDEYIKKAASLDNVCLGKKPGDLIALLGDRPLFVCPQNAPRNPDGTCQSGTIPYQMEEDSKNLQPRNAWILKYCSK